MAVALLVVLGGCGSDNHAAFNTGTLVLVGGDLHFGENYARFDTGELRPGALDDEQRYTSGLAGLKPFVTRSAFAVVNLETPLSRALFDGLKGKQYVHWTDPAKAAPAIAALGIDAVGMGNNHALDQGESGVRKSLVALKDNNLRWFGIGINEARGREPLLQEIDRPGGGKVMLAFFGGLEEQPAYRNVYHLYGEAHKAGPPPLDAAIFARQVAALRAQYPNLYVIAFPHWGKNYSWAKASQIALGRALIDGGADIVIGQHGHAAQEIERYHGKWVLYGIGNFAFASPGRYRTYKIKPFGLLVQLSFGAGAGTPPVVRLYPIRSDNRITGYRPAPATRSEAVSLLSAIEARPASIGFAGEVIDDDPLGPAIELRKRAWFTFR